MTQNEAPANQIPGTVNSHSAEELSRVGPVPESNTLKNGSSNMLIILSMFPIMFRIVENGWPKKGSSSNGEGAYGLR